MLEDEEEVLVEVEIELVLGLVLVLELVELELDFVLELDVLELDVELVLELVLVLELDALNDVVLVEELEEELVLAGKVTPVGVDCLVVEVELVVFEGGGNVFKVGRISVEEDDLLVLEVVGVYGGVCVTRVGRLPLRLKSRSRCSSRSASLLSFLTGCKNNPAAEPINSKTELLICDTLRPERTTKGLYIGARRSEDALIG